MIHDICYKICHTKCSYPTTRKVAKNLGLTVYTKNLSDGTVYIEAEGPEEKLLELLEFSKKGPKYVHVENVNDEIKEPQQKFKSFDNSF